MAMIILSRKLISSRADDTARVHYIVLFTDSKEDVLLGDLLSNHHTTRWESIRSRPVSWRKLLEKEWKLSCDSCLIKLYIIMFKIKWLETIFFQCFEWKCAKSVKQLFFCNEFCCFTTIAGLDWSWLCSFYLTTEYHMSGLGGFDIWSYKGILEKARCPTRLKNSIIFGLVSDLSIRLARLLDQILV